MSPEERFQIRAIKIFGPVWDATLRKLWNDPALNLKMIQQQLGINIRTLHQCAIRLELPYPKPGENNTNHGCKPKLPPRREDILPETREGYRAAFLAAKEKYPEVGITVLQEKMSKVCFWLVRNDLAWFEANKPPLKRSGGKHPQLPYTDWHSRDLEFVAKVKPTALRLKNEPGRPVQITKTTLIREIGIKHWTHLPKLRLTAQAVAEMVETIEEYQVRRVWWVANSYLQEKINPTRWQFIRRTGIEKGTSHPLVKEAIDAALEMLSVEIGA